MTRRFRTSGRSRFLAVLGAGLLLFTACAEAGDSPSASAPSASEAVATATPVASDTPEPTPTPTPELLEPSAYGARATVAVDRLRVRRSPSLSADVTAQMEGGTEVRPMQGPVTADGLRWYWVSYGSQIDMRYPGEEAGWVAEVAVDASGEEVGEAFIEIGSPTCPGAVDAEMLAGLSLYAVDVCDVQVSELQGLIDMCIEGPIGPFSYRPRWVWFACPYLRDDEPRLIDSEWFYNLAFLPDIQQPERGDLVTLHGQIGFDEAQYGDCTVAVSDPGGGLEAELAVQEQLWDRECQLKFVVSEVEVTDHIELPPPF
jgi:hypothetical protein